MGHGRAAEAASATMASHGPRPKYRGGGGPRPRRGDAGPGIARCTPCRTVGRIALGPGRPADRDAVGEAGWQVARSGWVALGVPDGDGGLRGDEQGHPCHHDPHDVRATLLAHGNPQRRDDHRRPQALGRVDGPWWQPRNVVPGQRLLDQHRHGRGADGVDQHLARPHLGAGPQHPRSRCCDPPGPPRHRGPPTHPRWPPGWRPGSRRACRSR